MSLTHKIAKNTIFQVIGKVASMLITVLATVIITRFYGREGYGEFSLLQNWPALFFVIVDFGINAIATREISKDWSKASEYFGTILTLRTVFSAAMMFLVLIVIQFFPYSASLKFGLYLSLFLILTQAIYASTNIIFQVKLRYDLSTIGYLSGYGLILLFILFFSFLHINIAWVNFAYVIGGLLTIVVNFNLVNSLGIKVKFEYNKEIANYLMLSALPLGFMFVFSQINFKADSILMSVLHIPQNLMLNNTEAVAIYSLPYKIFEVALVIPTFFMNSVYPVLVVHMQHSREKLKSTFVRSFGFLLISGIIAGVFGILFSGFAIKLLGGSQFTQSVLVLQILLGGLVLYYLTQPLAWLIVTLGKQKYLPFIYLVSAIFNVTANYIFIPKYAFYASSVITHLSEFLILLMLLFAAHKAWKSKYAKAS